MLIGVSYADAKKYAWLRIEVEENITVRDAIFQSGILIQFPNIDLEKQKVGIFGKFTKLDSTLNEGDRVEIYRPITADPETVPRRQRDTDD